MGTTSRIVVLLTFLLSVGLTCVPQTPSSNQAPASRNTSERVILRTTVLDKKNKFSSGLTRDNFRVLVDKQPAEIVEFYEEDTPASVGILFDASASVANQNSRHHITLLVPALRAFVDTSNRSNEYFLIAFNTRPQLLMDWTSDHQALIGALGGVSPRGITALYDACYLGIEKVQRGRYNKRVLVLITDGQDNNSNYTLKQVREALRDSDVLLYAINFAADDSGSSLATEGNTILEKLSADTGGMFFYKKEGARLSKSSIASAFEVIATELRQQYTIAIKLPVSGTDTDWHKVKIQIIAADNATSRLKGLSARTREGFYLRD